MFKNRAKIVMLINVLKNTIFKSKIKSKSKRKSDIQKLTVSVMKS